MRVISHQNYPQTAEFDPTSGALTVIADRATTPNGETQTNGLYALLGESTVVFFSSRGQLCIRVDGTNFPADEQLSLKWRLIRPSEYDANSNLVSRAESELALSHPEVGRVQLRYPSGPADGPPLSEDPTAFISDEDYDFGLLINGIITDSERRRVMLGN